MGMGRPDGPTGGLAVGGDVFGVALGVGVALAVADGVALWVTVGPPVGVGPTPGEWRGIGRSVGWRRTPESSTMPPMRRRIKARTATTFQPRRRGSFGMGPFDQVPVR